MSKRLAIITVFLLLMLLITASQVSATAPDAKKTPDPNNPNPGQQKQTEKAQDAAEETEEAEKESAEADEDGKKEDKPDNSDRKATQAVTKTLRAAERQTQAAEKAQAKPGKKVHYKGTVESFSGSSLTITLKDGSSATVLLDDDTSIHFPGGEGELAEGLTVGVLAAQSEEGDPPVAIKIQVITGKPEKIHRVGIVTSYSPGASITIEGKKGTTTFAIDPEVKILPEERADLLAVGSSVTIISRRNPAGSDPVASGIVVHPAKEEAAD
jgi:hypothetical protein